MPTLSRRELAGGVAAVAAQPVWMAAGQEAPAAPRMPVWMMPPPWTGNGQCLRELLNRPDEWKQTRAAIDGMGYWPWLLNVHFSDAEIRTFFARLAEWKLPCNMEVPVLKKEVPTAREAFAQLEGFTKRFRPLGWKVEAFSFDEPAYASRHILGYTPQRCAEETAAYIGMLRAVEPKASICAIEPYPALTVAELCGFVDNLKARCAATGVRGIDTLRLDIDWAGMANQLSGSWKDVKAVEEHCRAAGVKFSLICWASDYPYLAEQGMAGGMTWYTGVMHTAQAYALAGGRPDHYMVESWVHCPEHAVPEAEMGSFSRSVLDLAAMVRGRKPAKPAAAPTPAPVAAAPDYAAEAARLTDLMHRTFWRPAARQYAAPVRSAETVDSDGVRNNAYVLWPALVALSALTAAEKARPGRYARTIAEVYDGLEAYWDPAAHAYNAWLTFPGNRDRYYDDNAWAIVTLVEAYEATRQTRYRDRAAEIMRRFMPQGWSEGKPGGMTWGVDPTKAGTGDKGACSTSGAALAALALARVRIDRAANIAFAGKAVDWVLQTLKDADGLIRDGLGAPDWHMNATKWTYNTGVPIQVCVELHAITGDAERLKTARALAEAAMDRNKRLYDGLVQDPARRHWYDASFFVHYLVDGLLALHKATGDARILAEVRRNADYAVAHLRDPADGLYWRNWRLWMIGQAQYEDWARMTGQTHRLEADESERSKEKDQMSKPVDQRPLVKTLLANAAVARMMWSASAAGR